jgi:hypothetical protein
MMKRNENKAPKGLRPLQKSFFSLLGQEGPKPIPPKLVRIFGYPLSAMISQLLFWKGMEMRKDGYIYKTEKDFLKELGLSSAQQKLAIKKAKVFGFFDVVRKGIPAKRHYRLNYNRLVEVTINEAERKKIVLAKSYNKSSQNNQIHTSTNNLSNTDNTNGATVSESTSRYHKLESAADIIAKKSKRG